MVTSLKPLDAPVDLEGTRFGEVTCALLPPTSLLILPLMSATFFGSAIVALTLSTAALLSEGERVLPLLVEGLKRP